MNGWQSKEKAHLWNWQLTKAAERGTRRFEWKTFLRLLLFFFRLILKQQFLNSVVWRFHVTRRDAMLERRSQNHTVRSWVEMNRSSNQSPIIIIVVVVEEHKPIVKLLQKSFLVLADKTKCVTRVWQLFVFYFTSLFFYVFCLQKLCVKVTWRFE